jgi:hypothetical protein
MIQPDFEDESLLPKKPRSMTRMTKNRDNSKGTQKSGDGFTRQTLGLPRELDGFKLLALAGLVLPYFALSSTGADGDPHYCLLLTPLWVCEAYEPPNIAKPNASQNVLAEIQMEAAQSAGLSTQINQ